ncbi:hypothetical protein D0T51_10835 [Parabacteroides sp. 52]|nr:hypothetical protein [Parabacteroides sp. 52]
MGNPFKQCAYLLFSCIILILPALLLKTRWYFGLQSVFFLLSPLEIAHIVLNRMPITEGFMSVVIHTDYKEAYELLSFLHIYLWIGILLLGFYYWILFTRIENKALFTLRGKVVIGIVFAFFNIGLWAAMWRMSGFRVDDTARVSSTNAYFKKKYTKTYPLDLITATRDVFASQREVRKMEAELKDFSFGMHKKDSLSAREIYVFVIGEAARYGNFSMHGYTRPTTPLLEQCSRLISYSNVLATSNYTSAVLQLMLTRATPLDPELAHKEKGLTDAFKEGGFEVAWIANQSVGDRFVQRLTSCSDYTYFSTTDYDSAESYDEKLFIPFASVLQQKKQKQFIVIHTLGSHFRYNARYPESFCHFTPALYDNTSYGGVNPENKELLVNSYDNSIYYTDYVLNEIISMLEKEKAVSSLVYLSDHGENLYDDASHMAVHGNTEPSRFELHVPLIVWTSPRYEEVWPEKVNNIEKHKDLPISTSNLFHSLLDIAGMSYPSASPELSIASPAFQADSVRYVLTPDKRVVEKTHAFETIEKRR